MYLGVAGLLDLLELKREQGEEDAEDVPARPGLARAQPRMEEEEVKSIMVDFQRQVAAEQKRQLPATAAGLEQALVEIGVEVRFNVRSSQLEFRAGHGVWQRLHDRAEAQQRERIAETFDELLEESTKPPRRLLFGRGRWRQALNALLADREVDPFRIWLEGLPAWDESPRLDSWIRKCFDVEPNVSAALCSWAAQSVFLAAVWRAYRPGTKHDIMVVLVGPQGVGKSTAFAWMFPPSERALWFSDGLNLNSSDKVKVEGLQGRVLVESSEMTGATRAELDRLKAFLSRVEDGTVRLAYRANPEPLPRRAVIVGSTNQFDCLPNDPSGNRRFVPIGVTAGDAARVRSWFDDNRLQLWAEALHRYRAEEEAYLPDGLAEIQATATERHRAADDVVENLVDEWLEKAETDLPEHFRLEDAAVGAGLVDHPSRVSRDLAVRLRNVLKLRGCVPVRKRLGGAKNPTRCYCRPTPA